jgi:hypothetical protein
MKQLTKILLSLTILFFASCGQGQIKTPAYALDKFEKLKNKEKFVEDSKLFYPGIGDEKLKPILTSKIDLAIEDFQKVSQLNNPTDKDYQNAIKKALERFSEIYLNIDTENRERICYYFEELMDIVGLESSNGLLNDFMYDFDRTPKQ